MNTADSLYVFLFRPAVTLEQQRISMSSLEQFKNNEPSKFSHNTHA